MWTVFADYRLVDDASNERWIASAGPPRPAYDATTMPGLPEALDGVYRAWSTMRSPSFEETSPGVRALFSFVRAYGHLGRTSLTGAPVRITEGEGLMLLEGDPLLWALDHAANVYEILALNGGMKHRRTKALERYLVGWQQRIDQRKALGDWTPPPMTIPTIAPPWSAELPDIERPLHEALAETATVRRRTALEGIGDQLLSARLNPNLAGVNRTYKRGAVPFKFDALIQLIYWQLGDSIETGTPRQCTCGAWFFATDPRQRYCAPPSGVPESRCATRFRMRRYDAGKRQAAGRQATEAGG